MLEVAYVLLCWFHNLVLVIRQIVLIKPATTYILNVTANAQDSKIKISMDHRTDYIKIRTALTLNRRFDLTSKGFSQEFKDKLTDYEESFRAKIIIPINDTIGLHNWAILFTEIPEPEPKYFCDIYTDDTTQYSKVVAIIKERIEDVEFYFSYKGTVMDYLND